MVILENIDIDIGKAILQNIDIVKITNRFKFGISNRASWRPKNKYFGLQTSGYENVENPPKRAFWPYKLKL